MKENKEILFLENQLCFPLYATSRLTTKVYGPYLKELDLTYPQYLVLMVLWEEDGLSVNRISKRLHLETNTLTPLLKRLESKGLISRERSKADERSVEIKLQKAGWDLQAKALKIPAKIISTFQGADISVEELKQFQKTLFRLLNSMEAQMDS